jgi:hypothetical protein
MTYEEFISKGKVIFGAPLCCTKEALLLLELAELAELGFVIPESETERIERANPLRLKRTTWKELNCG